MSSSTFPRTSKTPPSAPGTRAGTGSGAGSGSGSGAARPAGFWRGPFSSRTYRELGYIFASLPVAVAGFAFAVAMFSLSAGLAVTVVGLPVAAGMLAGARAFGAAERGRARMQLGLDVTAPGVPAARNPGLWPALSARLTDAAGWRALLFQLLMFPWRVASFVLSLTFLVTGWAVALYPAYHWVFPRYVGWPGYQVYAYTSHGAQHAYYLTSPLQIGAFSLLGLAIVFLTPKLVHGLTSVDRGAVRTLLGK
ncbi:sensor domain-containing protein [Streptomyces sp. NBC_00388]|uniref:sensor domain-containing protein n=1 Tax=Streptomyces sp. NBC_00388 TaxID=2975735 RepID=UPI002E1D7B32